MDGVRLIQQVMRTSKAALTLDIAGVSGHILILYDTGMRMHSYVE